MADAPILKLPSGFTPLAVAGWPGLAAAAVSPESAAADAEGLVALEAALEPAGLAAADAAADAALAGADAACLAALAAGEAGAADGAALPPQPARTIRARVVRQPNSFLVNMRFCAPPSE